MEIDMAAPIQAYSTDVFKITGSTDYNLSYALRLADYEYGIKETFYLDNLFTNSTGDFIGAVRYISGNFNMHNTSRLSKVRMHHQGTSDVYFLLNDAGLNTKANSEAPNPSLEGGAISANINKPSYYVNPVTVKVYSRGVNENGVGNGTYSLRAEQDVDSSSTPYVYFGVGEYNLPTNTQEWYTLTTNAEGASISPTTNIFQAGVADFNTWDVYFSVSYSIDGGGQTATMYATVNFTNTAGGASYPPIQYIDVYATGGEGSFGISGYIENGGGYFSGEVPVLLQTGVYSCTLALAPDGANSYNIIDNPQNVVFQGVGGGDEDVFVYQGYSFTSSQAAINEAQQGGTGGGTLYKSNGIWFYDASFTNQANSGYYADSAGNFIQI